MPLCSLHLPRCRGWGALALGVVVVATAPGIRGQEVAPARGVAAAARPVPEGLNFANGLFQQRHYTLAAEEYERLRKLARLKAPSFAEMLLAMPQGEIEFGRAEVNPRDVEF